MKKLIDKSQADLIALIEKLQVDCEIRKRVEFQKGVEQFKRLFDALPDAVFITRIGGENSGQILDMNIAAERQTGYDRNELLKMNILNDLSTDTFDKTTFEERV